MTDSSEIPRSLSQSETLQQESPRLERPLLPNLRCSLPETGLYFDDPASENDPFDRTKSDWHEMLSAPLFTNSVLESIEAQMSSGK